MALRAQFAITVPAGRWAALVWAPVTVVYVFVLLSSLYTITTGTEVVFIVGEPYQRACAIGILVVWCFIGTCVRRHVHVPMVTHHLECPMCD